MPAGSSLKAERGVPQTLPRSYQGQLTHHDLLPPHLPTHSEPHLGEVHVLCGRTAQSLAGHSLVGQQPREASW